MVKALEGRLSVYPALSQLPEDLNNLGKKSLETLIPLWYSCCFAPNLTKEVKFTDHTGIPWKFKVHGNAAPKYYALNLE